MTYIRRKEVFMVKVTSSHRDGEFENGTSISVSDGHLYVYRLSDIIAIYAPGCWQDAVVEPKKSN